MINGIAYYVKFAATIKATNKQMLRDRKREKSPNGVT